MIKKITYSLLLWTCTLRTPVFSEDRLIDRIKNFFYNDNSISSHSVWQNSYFRSLAFIASMQIDNIPLSEALINALRVWDSKNIDKLTQYILANNKSKIVLPLNELLNLTDTYLIAQNAAIFSFIIINNSFAENLVEKTSTKDLEYALIKHASSIRSPDLNLNNLLIQSTQLLEKDPNKILILTQEEKLISISKDDAKSAMASIDIEIPLSSNEGFYQSLVALSFDPLTINLASYLYNLAGIQGKTYLMIAISTADNRILTKLCNRCALHSSINNISIMYASVQVAFDYPLIYDFASSYYTNKFSLGN